MLAAAAGGCEDAADSLVALASFEAPLAGVGLIVPLLPPVGGGPLGGAPGLPPVGGGPLGGPPGL